MSNSSWRLYRKRWIIETIFRDLKSYLHLEECYARTLKAQINHINACMDAFLFLKNKYPDKSIETARQDYLNIYHSEKVNNYAALSCAA
ncbi:MAG: transposase [bacterium]